MNYGPIINTSHIDTTNEAEAIESINSQLRLASQWWQRYQGTDRVISQITDTSEAKQVADAYFGAQASIEKLHRRIGPALAGEKKDLPGAIDALNEFNDIFEKMESIYQKHSNLYAAPTTILNTWNEQLFQEVNWQVNNLQQTWVKQNQLESQIKQGIDDLLNIKKHLNAAVEFKDQIEGEVRNNKLAQTTYLRAFIGVLLTIPLIVAVSYFAEKELSLAWYEGLAIRITYIIPALWVARLFSKNYSQARLASVKFDHLNRLLGQGAASIAKLVETDPEAKSDVNKRLAELFLDIKDLAGVASSEVRHPIAEVKELLEVAKIAKDISK